MLRSPPGYNIKQNIRRLDQEKVTRNTRYFKEFLKEEMKK